MLRFRPEFNLDDEEVPPTDTHLTHFQSQFDFDDEEDNALLVDHLEEVEQG